MKSKTKNLIRRRSLLLAFVMSLVIIGVFQIDFLETATNAPASPKQASETNQLKPGQASSRAGILSSIQKTVPKNEPKKGLVYNGLSLAKDAKDPCAGAYSVAAPINKSKANEKKCTPGPDPIPDGKRTPVTRSMLAAHDKNYSQPLSQYPNLLGASVTCYGNGSIGRRVQALYVTTAGNDQSATVVPDIKIWAAYMDMKLNESAQKTGGTRHIKWLTDSNCEPTVSTVIVDPAALNDVGTTAQAVADQGYNRDDRNYLMWTDDDLYCGIAFMHLDDRPDPTVNNNNVYGSYGRVDRQCWGYTDSTELHEFIHMIGGV